MLNSHLCCFKSPVWCCLSWWFLLCKISGGKSPWFTTCFLFETWEKPQKNNISWKFSSGKSWTYKKNALPLASFHIISSFLDNVNHSHIYAQKRCDPMMYWTLGRYLHKFPAQYISNMLRETIPVMEFAIKKNAIDICIYT